MPERTRDVRYHFQVPRPARSRKTVVATSLPLGAALPRITRLMALAIKLDRLLQQRPDLDGVELARCGSISRSRLTQILNLLHLAPDIQERLLWLPPVAKGREVISEKTLRQLTGEYHWERQRERFEQLLSRRLGT
jgi:hypothetical protein